MKLFMHNYSITPAIVTQVIHHHEGVAVRRVNIPDKGIYTPVTGLLKIGMSYPTPNGRLPIKSIGEGYMQF